MKVTLLAHTDLTNLPHEVIENTAFGNMDSWWSGEYSDADRLAHLAGRACYQAWEMPNSETRSDEGYLNNIIKQGHFSVLEHATATFYVQGVSRSLTHELVRHRHLSYSQLSQRYVEMKDAEFVLPPLLRDVSVKESPELAGLVREMSALSDEAKYLYEKIVTTLTSQGVKRKQAREAARSVLPNNMSTDIVVSGNHRAWRDMLFKRYSVHADAEIRELATEILEQLRYIAPGSFQDFPDEPFS